MQTKQAKGKSFAAAKGKVSLKIFDQDKLIKEFKGNNLVVVGGREALAHLAGGDVGTTPNQNFCTEFGVGTDDTAVTDADSGLTSAFTKSFDSVTYPNPGTVQFNFIITTAEANGLAINEFGLFTEDGTLFARIVVSEINKTNSIRIEGNWQLIF